MKFIASLIFASVALAQNFAAGQTPTPAQSHPTTHAATATHVAALHGCAKVPELSPNIPAAPAGSPCAKPLYSITTVPNITLTDISPLETPDLRDALGIPTAATFSLAYIDTKIGTGALAAPHKWYSIQYTGYLTDGSKFDSSYDKPEHDPLNFLQGPTPGPQGRRMVVIGMDTGIDGMHVGGKRRLFIPYQLGYGPAGNPPKIPAKSWLIFDIELVAQNDKEPAPKAPPTPPTPPTSQTQPTPPPAASAPTAPAPPASTAPSAASPDSPAAQPAPTAAPPAMVPPVAAPKPR